MSGLRLIQVNTDEDELDRHGIGAIGLHGDAAAVVPKLVDALSDVTRPAARAELAQMRRRFFADVAYLEPQLSYLEAIRAALPEDAILVEDVTQMGFVVCDQGADGIDVGLSFKGSMRRTVMPQG